MTYVEPYRGFQLRATKQPHSPPQAQRQRREDEENSALPLPVSAPAAVNEASIL
jgi:hypothetical protein